MVMELDLIVHAFCIHIPCEHTIKLYINFFIFLRETFFFVFYLLLHGKCAFLYRFYYL